MRRFDVALTALTAGLCMTLATSAVQGGGPQAVKISGGGTATFDFFEGGTTFSVQANIDADGNVDGHFYCGIPAFVAIVGDDLVEATFNSDGSITIFGFAHGWDAAVGVFTEMPFEVRVWSGGPLVGRFLYDDPVVGTVLVDTDVEGDHETVASGHIMITVN